MKSIFPRLVAALLIAVPGLIATYGFLAMKDSIFAIFDPDLSQRGFLLGKFLLGLLLFSLGVGFIGGWIFYRDRKRNYVAPRFKANRRKRK